MNNRNTSAIILALEMELNLSEQDLDVLSADSAYLERLQSVISYNINFLKKEAKIISAAEYKRTCVELSHIKTKLHSLASQINKLEKSIQNKTIALEFYYKMLDDELLIEEQKVLLFRRKDVR